MDLAEALYQLDVIKLLIGLEIGHPFMYFKMGSELQCVVQVRDGVEGEFVGVLTLNVAIQSLICSWQRWISFAISSWFTKLLNLPRCDQPDIRVCISIKRLVVVVTDGSYEFTMARTRELHFLPVQYWC